MVKHKSSATCKVEKRKRSLFWKEGLLACLAASLSVLIALLFSGYPRKGYPAYAPGEIVKADIVAPVDLTVEDGYSRRLLELAARQKILPVYRYDPREAAKSRDAVSNCFRNCRTILQQEAKKTPVVNSARSSRNSAPKKSSAASQSLRHSPGALPISGAGFARVQQEWRKLKEGLGDPDLIRRLLGERFRIGLEQLVLEILDRMQKQLILENRFLVHESREIVVQNLLTGLESAFRWDQLLTLTAARETTASLFREVGFEDGGAGGESLALLAQLVQPNLAPDPALTEERQRKAAAGVGPVFIHLKKGKVIARQGDEIRPEQMAQIEAVRNAQSVSVSGLVLSSRTLLAAVMLLLYGYFLLQIPVIRRGALHRSTLTATVLAIQLLVLKGTWHFYEVLSGVFGMGGAQGNSHLFFALPFAFGSILLALLAGDRVGMLFALFSGLFIVLGWDPGVSNPLFPILSALLGVILIGKAQQRITLVTASLRLGVANIVLFFLLQFAAGGLPSMNTCWVGSGLAFWNGIFSGILVVLVLPLGERVFNITTDIRLLELGNLNLPPIRDLIQKAPGTYNHSVAVGLLAEGAAKAIHLNPLFLRVAALYHDIGKTFHPEAFIENQQGHDLHDELSPQESVALLREHVLAGAKIARAAKTPSNVVELIPQHHGTRLMHSFYLKARKRGEESGRLPLEEDFRYAGPKPQTREAAILMMADTVEAAARAAQDRSAESFWRLIQKLVSLMTEDGQFSECDITLGELDRVAFSFLETLASVYHARIDYPGLGVESRKFPTGDSSSRR